MTRRAPWQAMNQDQKIALQSLRPHKRLVKEILRRERIAARAAAVPKVEYAIASGDTLTVIGKLP